MFNFWTVMYLLSGGALAGFLARLLVPGRDAIGFWWTMLIGIVSGTFSTIYIASPLVLLLQRRAAQSRSVAMAGAGVVGGR